MPPPPKGKAPTKGAKQILEENVATVLFYRNMAISSFLLYMGINAVFSFETFNLWIIMVNVLAVVIYVAAYKTMLVICKPHYCNEVLIDPGRDLNMEGGIGEHFKDVIILTSTTQVLASISNYFWLLLFLLPLRVMWMVWKHILGPWFFQEAPEETEDDEKKKKKKERKMRRYQ